MILPARIAARYLRAPKSHSAVGAISIISVVGVAVATAAIVCVLSVFNGFRSLLAERLDTLAPDITVVPAEGKTFADGDSLAAAVAAIDGVQIAVPSVTDNALAIFDSREMPVTLRGVDMDAFRKISSIDSLILNDERFIPSSDFTYSGEEEAPADALVSIGTASQLGIGATGQPLLIFAPKREERVNLANPMASFIADSLNVAGIFQAFQNDYDEKTVICPIEVARDLFQYTSEATSVDIKLHPGADSRITADAIASALGPGTVVKDRLQQQEMNFRMISIEKWVTFLLLIFILIIASFNIISTLCMLVLDKQSSLSVFRALGMRKGSVAAIFRWDSIFVTLIGGAAGIAVGLILCLLQQHFGIIRLAGDPERMLITAYPVVVNASDILIACIPILATGALTAIIAGAFARSRL